MRSRLTVTPGQVAPVVSFVSTRSRAVRGTASQALLVPHVRLSLSSVLLVNTVRLIGRLMRIAVQHPLGTLVVIVAWLWSALGTVGLAVLVVASVAVLSLWAALYPAAFVRLVARPARSRARSWWRYRRHWQPVMATTGLTTDYEGGQYVPRLVKVVTSPCVDSISVQLLAGQSPADYEARVDALAHVFDALSCRVRVDRPGRVRLDLTHADPLTETIAALDAEDPPDLTALPLGRTDSGDTWRLRVPGSHVLIAGATGAGKGSVLWSLVRSLSAGIRAGLVQVWAVDPKGGMELAFGKPLFHRLAYDSTESMLILFADAAETMRARQARLLGITRLHTPTPDEPLIVLLVDELAALTAYTDRDTKKRSAELLSLLLSQGRAVGVLVVAALQDPSKDVLPFRDLFPTRIALRLTEAVQVDMVLGAGARARGALCDRIPEGLPGVGYVQLEGARESVRVRAAHVSDDDLQDMATEARRPISPVREAA